MVSWVQNLDLDLELIVYYQNYNIIQKQVINRINDLGKRTGLKEKDVQSWLENQDTYTLHKPIRMELVNGIDDQWQADLVEMRNYKDMNFNYILTVIDIFSKYARVNS